MSIGTVFTNNRTQAVRLPVDVRLPEGVHKVEVRVRRFYRRYRFIPCAGQPLKLFLSLW